MPLLFASFPDSRKSSQLLEGYTATGDEVAALARAITLFHSRTARAAQCSLFVLDDGGRA
jgi:hypothetical protein